MIRAGLVRPGAAWGQCMHPCGGRGLGSGSRGDFCSSYSCGPLVRLRLVLSLSISLQYLPSCLSSPEQQRGRGSKAGRRVDETHALCSKAVIPVPRTL